jgi:hypothetical protein
MHMEDRDLRGIQIIRYVPEALRRGVAWPEGKEKGRVLTLGPWVGGAVVILSWVYVPCQPPRVSATQAQVSWMHSLASPDLLMEHAVAGPLSERHFGQQDVSEQRRGPT